MGPSPVAPAVLRWDWGTYTFNNLIIWHINHTEDKLSLAPIPGPGERLHTRACNFLAHDSLSHGVTCAGLLWASPLLLREVPLFWRELLAPWRPEAPYPVTWDVPGDVIPNIRGPLIFHPSQSAPWEPVVGELTLLCSMVSIAFPPLLRGPWNLHLFPDNLNFYLDFNSLIENINLVYDSFASYFPVPKAWKSFLAQGLRHSNGMFSKRGHFRQEGRVGWKHRVLYIALAYKAGETSLSVFPLLKPFLLIFNHFSVSEVELLPPNMSWTLTHKADKKVDSWSGWHCKYTLQVPTKIWQNMKTGKSQRHSHHSKRC